MTTPPRDERVAAQTLRRLFREHDFEGRAASGELTTKVRPRSEHLVQPAKGEPAGTVSRILQYFDAAGVLVAMTHEYLRPDGTLSASGQRDPKWLRVEGRVYKQRPEL